MFFRRERKSVNLILLSDMIVETAIGVYDEEKGRTQRVRINIVAEPMKWPASGRDDLAETVSYEALAQVVLRLTQGKKHIHLVETLAENIAQECLRENPIRKITVRVEKLDIYPYAVPGVEIVRFTGC